MAAPTATRTAAPARRRVQPGRRPPNPRPVSRPALKVVPPNTLTRRGRQRRARRFGAALSVILVVAIFGVVAAHVALTQRQFQLEQLEREAAAAEAQYERLRLEVAQLESPDRVVAAAQALGMVPPASVTYLASTRATPADGGERPAPSGEWATVKSHLAASKP
jgi:cell division protein FtsL